MGSYSPIIWHRARYARRWVVINPTRAPLHCWGVLRRGGQVNKGPSDGGAELPPDCTRVIRDPSAGDVECSESGQYP